MCVVRVVEGPFYSLRGRFSPALNMETCQTAFRRIGTSFPPKLSLGGCQVGSANPPLGAISHRPSLVHCLVGPDVRWSVQRFGWSVWSGLWASFAHVTQDTIVYDFYLRIRHVFILFPTCVPAIQESPKLVEFVSNNSYHYCCCSFFMSLCRN